MASVKVPGGVRRVPGGSSKVLAGVGIMILGCAGAALAQARPNALAAAVRDARARSGAVWLTYRVPIVPGPYRLCFDTITTRAGDPADLHLAVAPASDLVIYARMAGGRVERLRAFTPECPVEAGGTPIVPVAGVTPPESVAWLASVVGTSDDPAAPARDIVDPALLALSLHADPSALSRLIGIARDDPRSRVRGQALFWLSQRAGERAAAVIGGAIDSDSDAEVRKKAVFALSQLPKDEGVPKLIEVAQTSPHPAVRKQAIFWLGQSHDPRALTFFEEILRQ